MIKIMTIIKRPKVVYRYYLLRLQFKLDFRFGWKYKIRYCVIEQYLCVPKGASVLRWTPVSLRLFAFRWRSKPVPVSRYFSSCENHDAKMRSITSEWGQPEWTWASALLHSESNDFGIHPCLVIVPWNSHWNAPETFVEPWGNASFF